MTGAGMDRTDIAPGRFVRILAGPDKGRRARVIARSAAGVVADVVVNGVAKEGVSRRITLSWDDIRPVIAGRARSLD
jgi:hypothetical protein